MTPAHSPSQTGLSCRRHRLGLDRVTEGRRLAFVPFAPTVRTMNFGLLLPKAAILRHAVAAFTAQYRTQATSAALPGRHTGDTM